MPASSQTPLSHPGNAVAAGSGSNGVATLVLTLITFAGAWLRVSHLGAKSLWLDEGATAALAHTSWQHFWWVWWHGEANLQTIYFLLMRGWIHFGSSEAWLRLPSAIFGIVSIPAMYEVARKFVGVAASLAAAALLAFSPTHVYYSQEARSYTLAILLVLASTYFFLCALEQNRRRDWAFWTLASIAAFYSHDFAALVLVAQTLSLLFRPAAPWRRMILCGSVVFVAAIPGLTYVFRASPENLHFVWMPSPTGKEFWHLALFFGGSGVKIALALILWIAGIAAIVRSRTEISSDAFWRGVLVLLWALVPIALLALLSLHQPMFMQRYLIFSLPAFLLLAGYGVQRLRSLHAGQIIAVLLCGMSIPAIAHEYQKPREDWRAASHTVLSSAAPGDAVVFFPFYTRVMLDYYRNQIGPGTPQLHVFAPEYYDGGEDVRDLLQALDKNPRQFRHIWVLIADRGSDLQNFDYGDVLARKLQTIFGSPSSHHFTDVEVLEYSQE